MPVTELGRTGPLPRTAWTDRVRVLSDATGVRLDGLGELVENELDRADGVLFVTTPAAELDGTSRRQRLADAAWGGQVRTIVAMHDRMTRQQVLTVAHSPTGARGGSRGAGGPSTDHPRAADAPPRTLARP